MLKKILLVAGMTAGLLATNAWAGNANYCVKVEGEYIVNTCGETIEAAWCGGVGCDLSRGGSWTVQPRQKMPHSLPKGSFVNYGACSGANSIKKFSPYLTCNDGR
jgi:hypothetical protein